MKALLTRFKYGVKNVKVKLHVIMGKKSQHSRVTLGWINCGFQGVKAKIILHRLGKIKDMVLILT